MAKRTWVGRALDKTHILTATVTAYDAATTYSLTTNTKQISTIAAGNEALTVSTLATLWAAETAGEFQEATASTNGAAIILTGTTPGQPLIVTSGASGGTGSFGSFSNTTAPTGKNWWNNANNWAEGAVPVDGDEVEINGGPSILWGISQGSVDLDRLYIGPNFPASSEIGLPENSNPNNPDSGYPEYRTTRLTINADVVEIETISRRIRLDLSSVASTITINNSGQPQSSGESAIDITAGNDTLAATVYVSKASLALNGNCADLNVSYRTSPDSDVSVKCHRELTLTNLDMSGGVVSLENGATTITKSAGSLTLTAGNVGTLNNNGGTFYFDGNGTLQTVNNYGTIERRGFQPGEIGTLTLFAKSRFSDRNGTIAHGNDVIPSGCRQASGPEDRGDDVFYADFGRGRNLTVN